MVQIDHRVVINTMAYDKIKASLGYDDNKMAAMFLVSDYISKGDILMVFDKNWRPENWDRIKENIVNETPIVFSPSTGYSKDQKDQLMERTAGMVLQELAAVIVTEER